MGSGTALNMYKLVLCSFLALAAAAPLEDTAEVAAAKEAFNAAFAAAEAGEHAALRPDALHPVNTDVQAPQIAASYLDDIEDVAAAKAAFLAAFDDAAAGGLAAKQAPAPVHVLPEPTPGCRPCCCSHRCRSRHSLRRSAPRCLPLCHQPPRLCWLRWLPLCRTSPCGGRSSCCCGISCLCFSLQIHPELLCIKIPLIVRVNPEIKSKLQK